MTAAADLPDRVQRARHSRSRCGRSFEARAGSALSIRLCSQRSALTRPSLAAFQKRAAGTRIGQ